MMRLLIQLLKINIYLYVLLSFTATYGQGGDTEFDDSSTTDHNFDSNDWVPAALRMTYGYSTPIQSYSMPAISIPTVTTITESPINVPTSEPLYIIVEVYEEYIPPMDFNMDEYIAAQNALWEDNMSAFENYMDLMYTEYMNYVFTGSPDGIIQGGSQNNPIGKTYVPKTGDKFARNKNLIPDPIPKQIENLCTTESLAYIEKTVYGGNKKQGVFLGYAYTNMGVDVVKDGLTVSQIFQLTNRFFKTVTFTSWKGGIDNGHVFVTNITIGPDPEDPSVIVTHNVVVIGYQGDDLIYYDPQMGNFRVADPQHFRVNYAYEITGRK